MKEEQISIFVQATQCYIFLLHHTNLTILLLWQPLHHTDPVSTAALILARHKDSQHEEKKDKDQLAIYMYVYMYIHTYVYMFPDISIQNIIGASLSEPHTSVTALRTCVYMFVCLLTWTDHLPKILNERIQIFHEDRYREASEGQWRSDCQSAASATRSEDD